MAPELENAPANPQNEELLEDENIEVEEDIEDEDDSSDDDSKGKKKRRRLADDNVYVFTVSDPTSKESVKEAQNKAIRHLGKKREKKDNAVILVNDPENTCQIFYDDKTTVPTESQTSEKGSQLPYFRVFEVVEGLEVDEDGKKTAGKTVAFVCHNNQGSACEAYLDDKNISVSLAFKKRTRGRAKSKIEATALMFGRMLAEMLFEVDTPGDYQNGCNPVGFKTKDNYDESKMAQWQQFFAPGGHNAHYLDSEGKWKEANA